MFGQVGSDPGEFDGAPDRPYNASPDAMMVGLGAVRLLFQPDRQARSEEHTSELQSLMRNSYAVFCLKKKSDVGSTGTVRRRRNASTYEHQILTAQHTHDITDKRRNEHNVISVH